MMGVKARVFQAMVNVSLEDLVPADHFYRHVECILDLSFVRDLVRDRYSALGRPSIDPVVFFKLQLVMFFEGMRSEGQLERVGADRLSVRWYLGYDLHEPLPDHSRMTRIRDRYGVHIFRQFFEAIVQHCQDDGLIWGKELYADATLVEANADRERMLPRFAVEAHLHQLFGAAYEPPRSETHAAQDAVADISAAFSTATEPSAPRILQFPSDLPPDQFGELVAHNQERPDWYERNGEPDRSIKRGGYQRTSDVWVSLTDPDAVLMRQRNHGVHLRYRDHYLVDGGKACIIVGGSKPLLLIGAWSGVVGALLAFVANGLHSHPTDFRLEALLQQIADSPTWGSIHLLLICALVLILGAFVAITFTIDGEPGATVARFACLAALLGGALILVSTAMDGFAMKQLARSWLNAPSAEKATALRVADVLENAQYAVFSLSIVLFLGIGIFLYRLAIVLSSVYPKGLGWLALLSGAGAFVVGVVKALSGSSFRATEIFFVLFSMLSTIWVLIMGVVMWRKAHLRQAHMHGARLLR